MLGIIDFHFLRALIDIKAVLVLPYLLTCTCIWRSGGGSAVAVPCFIALSHGKAPARQHVKGQKLHRPGSHHMGVRRLLLRYG